MLCGIGHGFYDKGRIYDLSLTNINYKITFLNEVSESHLNAHHNLLLKSLSHGLTANELSSLSTTYISHKDFSKSGTALIDMTQKLTPYIYEHQLKNVSNVRNFDTLVDIGTQRFKSQNKIIIDYDSRGSWKDNKGAEGSFMIQYDQTQIEQDVKKIYENIETINRIIELSKNNILYITPVATPGDEITVSLSDLLIDILPKIKIPVLFNKNSNKVTVSPKIFLDDNLSKKIESIIFPNRIEDDIYHEMVIAGDADIIWDACRDSLCS